MKLLILLILLSCGKNKNTLQKRISDIDGDQILDSQEASPLDKYIAQVEVAPEIRGILYKSNEQKNGLDFGIRVSSVPKLKEQALRLLLRSRIQLISPFFSEQRNLNLELTNDIPLEKSPYVELDLTFEQTQRKPAEVLLLSGHESKSLGTWNTHMQISLSQEEYNNVLLKKSNLVLKFNEEDAYYNINNKKNQEIESKTYRIFYFDENTSKTIYVSNKMPFNDFIQNYGISEAKDIRLARPIQLMEKSIVKSWWYKKLDKSNYVIGFISQNEMMNFQEDNLKIKSGTINRFNGEPRDKMIVNFKKTNLVSIKVRGQISTRHFTLSTEDILSGTNGAPCKYYFRNMVEDRARSIEKYELEALSVFQDGQKYKLDQLKNISIKEGNDSNGSFFDIEFTSDGKELIFALDFLINGKKLIYGVYQNSCDPQNISNEIFYPEKSLFLNIDLNAEAL